MNKEHEKRTLSLYITKKLLPAVHWGKFIFFLAAIFFQQENTPAPFILCMTTALLLFGMDSFLKLSAWKCRHCKKILPHDFYSRKTIKICPHCQEPLDFDDHHFFTPE